jgi:hypothetical protein
MSGCISSGSNPQAISPSGLSAVTIAILVVIVVILTPALATSGVPASTAGSFVAAAVAAAIAALRKLLPAPQLGPAEGEKSAV